MILKSQNGEIFNLKLCYRIYREEKNIYAQLEVGERYTDYIIGNYKSEKRATEILDEIFDSMKRGKKIFVMPKR